VTDATGTRRTVTSATNTLLFVGAPVERRGTIVVQRLPAGGTIRIDGVTTSGPRITLDPGRHTVRLEAVDYRPMDTVVVVTAGSTGTITFRGSRVNRPVITTESTGTLMIRVGPFAKIFVDGRLAVEDVQLIRQLSAGTHRIRFEKDGFQMKDTTIVITAGDTIRRVFRLERKPE